MRLGNRLTRYRNSACVAVLLLALGRHGAAGQTAPAANASVRLTVYVPPRMVVEDVSSPSWQTTGAHITLTRQIVASANVEYMLRVRLVPGAAGRRVEVLDGTAGWREVPGEGSIPLFKSARLGVKRWTVHCRVPHGESASPPQDCPITYELVSLHPDFPMHVTVPGPETGIGH